MQSCTCISFRKRSECDIFELACNPESKKICENGGMHDDGTISSSLCEILRKVSKVGSSTTCCNVSSTSVEKLSHGTIVCIFSVSLSNCIECHNNNNNNNYRFAEAYFSFVHERAMDELDRVSQYYVDKAKSKLAKTVMALKIKHKFQALRLRSKIQAHIRGSCSRYALRRMQKILEIERNASFKAEGLYSMQVARMGMLDIAKKLPIAQALIRGFVYRARYRNQKRDVTKLQAFVRMMICVKAKAAKLKQIVCLQRALRMLAITEMYEESIRAAEKLQSAWKRCMWHSRKAEFGDRLRKACSKGNVENCVALLKLDDPRYSCLRSMPMIALVNISDRFTKVRPIHYAAQSGDVKMMTFLLRNGAVASAQDDIGESALHKSVAVGDRAFKITRMILQAAKKRGAAERIMSQRMFNFLCDFRTIFSNTHRNKQEPRRTRHRIQL